MATTFYNYEGTVIRVTREPNSLELASWSARDKAWVDASALYGYVTGIGGDGPADEITHDQARALIDQPTAPDVRMLDGPGSDPRYGNPPLARKSALTDDVPAFRLVQPWSLPTELDAFLAEVERLQGASDRAAVSAILERSGPPPAALFRALVAAGLAS